MPRPIVTAMRSHALAYTLAAAGAASCLGGCDARPCDAATLETALATAGPGDVVEVGACRIEGAFEVPDGVTLRGGEGSVLASVDARPVIETRGLATVVGLRVAVDHGGAGVVGRAGTLVLRDLDVAVTRGLGVATEAGSLDATAVSISGPITAENAAFASMSADETGTFGLVARGLSSGQTVDLDEVRVSGFAVAGVSVQGGTLTWVGGATGPDVRGVRGVGIAVFGAMGALLGVEVAEMLSGVGMPGIGVVASGSAGTDQGLYVDGLIVRDGAGYGVFGDGSTLVLRDARLADLGLMGVRVQGGLLDAQDLVAERNGGAGVLAIDTDSVRIERGRLDAQREALFVTTLGSVRVADGLEMVRDPRTVDAPPLDLTLVDVSFADNARAGLLLDANDGALAQLRLDGVTASASGAGYGAITQRTPVSVGWDASITRAGAAATNDASFSTPIDVVGIMMPPGLVATPPPF
jgi:hypothetical protein